MGIRRIMALSLASGAGLFFLVAPANAEEPQIVVTAQMKVPEGFEQVKMLVSIDDLDLSTPAGADRLEKRIGMVIKRFCGPPPRAERWQVKDARACSDFAWASARPQMDEAVRMASSG